MATTTFAGLQAASDSALNVRKALGAVVLVAPMTADPITAITGDSGQLLQPPAEYLPLGMFNPDGLSFTGESTPEETEAFGYGSAVRTDITKVSRKVTLSAFEVDRANVRELAMGMDLSEHQATSNGEVILDEPEIPVHARHRLLAIAMDVNKKTGREIYRAKFFPQVEISKFPEEKWGKEALSLELEFTNFLDEEQGYAVRSYIGGPGFDAAALGYKTA